MFVLALIFFSSVNAFLGKLNIINEFVVPSVCAEIAIGEDVSNQDYNPDLCSGGSDYIKNTKCPDDATYQSSFDHLNFNTIARDYFCSWMHSTPFNIPDEYRYSGDLKADSMGACAVSDADTCLTGIKTARSRVPCRMKLVVF